MDTLGRGHHLSKGLRHVTAWCIWRCRGGESLQAIEYGWNIAFKEEHGCTEQGPTGLIWQAAESH